MSEAPTRITDRITERTITIAVNTSEAWRAFEGRDVDDEEFGDQARAEMTGAVALRVLADYLDEKGLALSTLHLSESIGVSNLYRIVATVEPRAEAEWE